MAFSNPQGNITHLKLEPGYLVADLGAGSGHYTLAAAEAVGAGGKVYAVDIQKQLVERLKKEAMRRGYDNVEVVWGDLEAKEGSTLKSNSMNAVILSNTLFQVEDKETALSEVSRILKLGGRMLFIDWSDSFGGLGPQPGHVISVGDARKLLESAGFEIGEEIPARDHHYGFIARKKR
ncbi:MAG: methyltransferase domain-containing protein [Candidatus Paceibacterota bacterium]